MSNGTERELIPINQTCIISSAGKRQGPRPRQHKHWTDPQSLFLFVPPLRPSAEILFRFSFAIAFPVPIATSLRARPASRPNTPGMFTRSTADLLRPPVPSRPQTPAISSTQVLGGYGFSDVSLAENQAGLAVVPEGDLDTNVLRVMAWFISVLLPCEFCLSLVSDNMSSLPLQAFSLPHFVSMYVNGTASTTSSILMILAITLPSLLLPLSVLFRWPLLIPSGLFESTAQPHAQACPCLLPYHYPSLVP
jgi:hypothetical protein